jgi:hypothetical protein
MLVMVARYMHVPTSPVRNWTARTEGAVETAEGLFFTGNPSIARRTGSPVPVDYQYTYQYTYIHS